MYVHLDPVPLEWLTEPQYVIDLICTTFPGSCKN